MKLVKANAHRTELGKPENFTGNVWNQSLALGEGPSRLHVGNVTFSPGARTRWHTHSRGQILLVVSGIGRVQKDGGPVHELHPGDTVLIAPDERHWHGAAPDQLFSHIALQEQGENGDQARWLEAVSDAEYSKTVDAE